ncbi:MAG: hypothetical protein JSR69_21990 [Proteobacteria bacterium]|nr:hypothetical protein [Pseudomonadota bacterium]
MTHDIQFLQIKTDSAPKTSLNAKGGVSYALLKDSESTEAYFCLLANEGGGGYFSREAVPFSAIQRCLTGINAERPVPAKVFRKVFVGRSVNNAGFLVHALRHEGLLQPAPDAAHQHVLGDGWDDWKAKLLAQPGEPFELPDAKKDDSGQAAQSPVEQPTVSSKKDKKPKKTDTAGLADGDADPTGDENACAA